MAQARTKPNGPVAAAFLASGIGSFALGLLTTGAAASEGLANALRWSRPVGPLSGKSTLAVIVWLAAWIVLGSVWRRKEVRFAPAFLWTLILLGLGLLLTFPPFFEAFE
ncbi:MAG: hypothetical protein QN141_04370 [Armatimonadota bacterium]|nr:hypothetical protein [Armatimonadota bacterium]MDR7450599.1 hypothetical protein [Armatimonadota bacterium]MDR7466268.1 hypothetical protein [Armatimonadota bacterium]MDR7492989.1 hypothetical protein [Armatimonadota bacterium]MDR7498254.1 hypothetical protein [Armatimonadota bacterium]